MTLFVLNALPDWYTSGGTSCDTHCHGIADYDILTWQQLAAGQFQRLRSASRVVIEPPESATIGLVPFWVDCQRASDRTIIVVLPIVDRTQDPSYPLIAHMESSFAPTEGSRALVSGLESHFGLRLGYIDHVPNARPVAAAHAALERYLMSHVPPLGLDMVAVPSPGIKMGVAAPQCPAEIQELALFERTNIACCLAAKRGGCSFVIVPWSGSSLEREEAEALNVILYELRGRPLSMPEIQERLMAIAKTDTTVLLTGETGVGKGYWAERIHDESGRCECPFARVNCAALAEGLFRAELFGAKKGAFTGSTKDAAGKISAASTGTLFLDEIGQISKGEQAALLQLLDENGGYYRVGDTALAQPKCRFIAATNVEIDRCIREGKFLKDLLFRMERIEIPPLRECREEIPKLVRMFLRSREEEKMKDKNAKIRRPERRVCEEELNRLRDDPYGWPGNIRQLKRALLLACSRCSKDMTANDILTAAKECAQGVA